VNSVYSMKLNIHSLLRDKNVLYVTLFITIINMFAYLMFRQFDAVLFFVIIGLITSHFSKNMIIILLTAILSTNLAISIKLIGKVKEGMENKDKSKDAKNKDKDANNKDANNKDAKKKDAKKDKKKEGMESNANNKDANKDTSSNDKEPKCVGSDCKKKKDGFTQQLNPARINGSDDDDQDEFDSHPTVDYASTLESAYDNLDKLLSSDAINSMSEDTQRLAEKQQMLMGNINKLQPMMEKAGSMLEGLNMDKMTGMLGGIQEKLKGMKKA
jgi:hypothetical protein